MLKEGYPRPLVIQGNDPLTGHPADANLPDHDAARYQAYIVEQTRHKQEQWAAATRAQRAGQVFTGKGFVEAEWTAWLDRKAKVASMTDEQQAEAVALLEMAKQAAADYRKNKEADYKKIAADLAVPENDPAADPAKTPAVRRAAAELSAPIDEIGKKLCEDIKGLLTDEQLRKIGKR